MKLQANRRPKIFGQNREKSMMYTSGFFAILAKKWNRSKMHGEPWGGTRKQIPVAQTPLSLFIRSDHLFTSVVQKIWDFATRVDYGTECGNLLWRPWDHSSFNTLIGGRVLGWHREVSATLHPGSPSPHAAVNKLTYRTIKVLTKCSCYQRLHFFGMKVLYFLSTFYMVPFMISLSWYAIFSDQLRWAIFNDL